MKKCRFVSFLVLGLVAFLSISQWTYSQQEEDEVIYIEKEAYGFNFGIKLFGNLAHLIGKNDVNDALAGWHNLVIDSTQALDAN